MTTTLAKPLGKRMRQVKLRRPSERGHYEDVFWIIDELATIGKRVIDEADIVWTVAEKYGLRDGVELDREYRTWREFKDTLSGH